MVLTLQDIQADAAQAIDVGVIDLSQESDFGRSHRIIVRKEELESEDTA